MHLKVFLKLKKPCKLSLLGKYIRKPKKPKKKLKNPKKTKKPKKKKKKKKKKKTGGVL
jgi:hypothetical protein